MATHTQILTITYDENDLAPSEMCAYDDGRYLNEVANYLVAVASGKRQGTISTVQDGGDAVAASGIIELSGGVTDTKATATVTVEATAPGQAALSVSIGGNAVPYDATLDATEADVATGLAAAINSDVVVSEYVTATPNVAVVELVAKGGGILGNGLGLAATAVHLTPSGATFTGGVDAVTASVGGVPVLLHEGGVDDDASAVLLAALITSTQPLVTATASTGPSAVTVTAVEAGAAGNNIGLEAVGNFGSASVVTGGTLTGGSDATGATLFTIQS